MPWWIWIVLGAVLFAAEIIISADFYLVFFGLSALVVGLLGVSGVLLPNWGQWLLFAALAILALAIYRRRWRSRLLRADRELGPELVGESGVVTEMLPPGGHGKIELRGSSWEARNLGDAELRVGTRCVVQRVEGLTLFVRSED